MARQDIAERGERISAEEQKQILISILDEIAAYCDGNGLTYFLVGGTLLGAVRHRGFIPWDDDIDIGMPRKDYEKLIKDFQSVTGNVRIICEQNTEHYIWPNAKAIDKRTIVIEANDPKRAIGVFVDVFPFDGIKGNRDEATKTVLRSLRWKNALTLKHLKTDPQRNILKNLAVVFSKVLYLIPDHVFIRKINRLRDKPDEFADCDYVCNLTGAWGLRELSKSEDFFDYTEAEFEGKKYKVPHGYDDYLTTVYGDYMKLPPEEKRVSHHDNAAYWRKQDP